MARDIITQEDNITTADLLRRGGDGHSEGMPMEHSGMAAQGGHEPLFPGPELEEFRRHWSETQANFVDEPKPSVEKADQLVASVIQRLTQVFADERSRLEKDWSKGGEVSTEDLRQALRRYRSFFDRLLSV
jgi:hypothetical protein